MLSFSFEFVKKSGSLQGSTGCTEAPANEFTFAQNPLAERWGSGSRYVIPLNVFNVAAPVADEVVMLRAPRIEAGGPAFKGHFTHQTSLHQIPQIVVSRGS